VTPGELPVRLKEVVLFECLRSPSFDSFDETWKLSGKFVPPALFYLVIRQVGEIPLFPGKFVERFLSLPGH
jgi:hypothetical protein